MELVWCTEYQSKLQTWPAGAKLLYASLVLFMLSAVLVSLGKSFETNNLVIGSVCFVIFVVSTISLLVCIGYMWSNSRYIDEAIVKINNEKVLTDGFLEKYDLVEKRGEYYLFRAKNGVKEETIDVG